MSEVTTEKPMMRICHKCGDASDGFYCADCRECLNEARRNRRRIQFRNCFCGCQAEHQRDGSFFCGRHFQMERMREFQDPAVTAENIRRSNMESEKRRYARLKEAGICVTCGKRDSYFGCIRCEKCQAKRRELKRRSLGKPLSDSSIHPWKAANQLLFTPIRNLQSPITNFKS